MQLHYAWIVTGLACLALLTVAGVRSSFRVFAQPLQHECDWDRTAISVTAVLDLLLYGALGPLAGRLADRYGPRWFAERRAMIMGLRGAAVPAGPLACLPLAAHVEMAYGPRWSFAGMGLILPVVALPLVARFLRDDPSPA